MGFLGLRREVEGVEGVSVVISEPGYSCFTTACIIVVSSFEDGEDDGVSDENELLDT